MNIGRMNAESAAYRQARDSLLEAEIALRDQRERVAEQRRKLPLDTAIEDYVFHEGPADLDLDGPVSEVRISELLGDTGKPFIVYQYMYGGAQNAPCSMCTMWVDGLNGVARHIGQTANLAIVAEVEIGPLRSLGQSRNWQNLRLLSCAGSSFKADLNFQDQAGGQFPGVSVFGRAPDGSPRHSYSAAAIMKDGEYRGIDLLSPVWNLLDLTTGGRGEWLPSLAYD